MALVGHRSWHPCGTIPEGHPPLGDHDAAGESGNRRPPYPQEIDRVRALGPPWSGTFDDFKRVVPARRLFLCLEASERAVAWVRRIEPE